MHSFVTGLVAVSTLFTSTFAAVIQKRDIIGGSKLAVYYGQGGDQRPLEEFCNDDTVDIIPIGFVTAFPGMGTAVNGYPAMNFGNMCDADEYWVDPQKGGTKMFHNCKKAITGISACQAKGKKILLSLGGQSSVRFKNEQSAADFATFIWGAVGPYSPSWKGPRPFGNDIEVDGIDFDIETPQDPSLPPVNTGIAAATARFRTLWGAKQRMLTAAPQCIVPDAHLTDVLNKVSFDALFIQFYNTPECSARSFFDKSFGKGISYDKWITELTQNSVNKGIKAYIGLPAAPGAASPRNYLEPAEMQQLATTFSKKYPSFFGGIMLWEMTWSDGNRDSQGNSYAQVAKLILNNQWPPRSTTTTATTTTTSTTKSTTITTTTKSTTTTTKSVTTTAASTTPSATTTKSTTSLSSITKSVSSSSSSASPVTTLSTTTKASSSSTSSTSSSSTTKAMTSLSTTTSSSVKVGPTLSSTSSSTSDVTSKSTTTTSSEYNQSTSTTKDKSSSSTSSSTTSSDYGQSTSTTKDKSSSSSSRTSNASTSSSESSTTSNKPTSTLSESTSSKSTSSFIVGPTLTSESTSSESTSSFIVSPTLTSETTSSESTSSFIVGPTLTSSTSSSEKPTSTYTTTTSDSYTTSASKSYTLSSATLPFPDVSSSTTTPKWEDIPTATQKTSSGPFWSILPTSFSKPTTSYDPSRGVWSLLPTTTAPSPVDPWRPYPPTDDSKPSVTITIFTTSYIDICPTGYTTIALTTTITYTPTEHVDPKPTNDHEDKHEFVWPTKSDGCPSGFFTTKTICTTGCGEGVKTVTLTLPQPQGVITQTVVPIPAESPVANVKADENGKDSSPPTQSTWVDVNVDVNVGAKIEPTPSVSETAWADATAIVTAAKDAPVITADKNTPVAAAATSVDATLASSKPSASPLSPVKQFTGAASTVQTSGLSLLVAIFGATAAFLF